jgi:hypothetical protein
LLGEHGGMRLGRQNILPEKVPIKLDGGVDFLHDRVGARGKASTPHLVGHDTSKGS